MCCSVGGGGDNKARIMTLVPCSQFMSFMFARRSSRAQYYYPLVVRTVGLVHLWMLLNMFKFNILYYDCFPFQKELALSIYKLMLIFMLVSSFSFDVKLKSFKHHVNRHEWNDEIKIVKSIPLCWFKNRVHKAIINYRGRPQYNIQYSWPNLEKWTLKFRVLQFSICFGFQGNNKTRCSSQLYFSYGIRNGY